MPLTRRWPLASWRRWRGGTGRYQFFHAITRDTLYQDQPASKRLELHRNIGECLESVYGTESGSHIGQLAYHFAEAAKAGTAEKAVNYARQAGDQALERLAYEDAAGHYGMALRSLPFAERQDKRQRAELLLAQGVAATKTAALRDAKAPLREAFDAGRDLDDVRLVALSALAFSRTGFQVNAIDTERIKLLEDALAMVGGGDVALRARLCSELASALAWSKDVRRRDELADEAVELSREANDPEGRLEILRGWLEANWRYDRRERTLETARDLIDAGREFESPWHEAAGHVALRASLLETGDVKGADEEARILEDLVEKKRLKQYGGWVAAYPATKAILEGRFDEADLLVPQTLAAFQNSGDPDTMLYFGLQLFVLRMFQGRLAELKAAIGGVVAQYESTTAAGTIMVFFQSELGNDEEARKGFDELARENFADSNNDPSRHATLIMLSEVCGYLEDVARAETLYDLLAEYASRNGVHSGVVCTGSIAHQVALLLSTAGRLDEAEVQFQAALEANERMGARPCLARTQHEYARMLLKRDADGDLEKARPLLGSSLETAEDIGMAKLVADIIALKLELQGVTVETAQNSIETVARSVQAERPNLRPHAAPDGTITLLFTDIVGSTALNERLGDQRWMELLREHNALVREQIHAYDGYEVKTEGDGFMVAFGSARKAVQSAVAIQRGFAERNETAEEKIEVRAGLHTGEPVKEDNDFYGKHVNLAARIASQADGGQILVSALLKELTESGGDIAFDGGKEIELKGLTGTQRVFCVGWE